MTTTEWIVWAVTETLKMLLITYGIMGFKLCKEKWRYLIFFYLFLWFPIHTYLPDDVVFYEILWRVLFVQILFAGNWIRKLQMFLIEYIAIGCVDGLIWSVFIFFESGNIAGDMLVWRNLCNTLGVLVWVLVVLLVKNYRKQYHEYIEHMKWRYYIVILMVLLCMSGVMANAQGNVMGEMTEDMRKAAYLLSVVALLIIIIIFCIFAHTLYRKTQLEFEKDLNEKLIAKEESIRRFRHETQRHFNVLHKMVQEKKIKEMELYLKEISDDFSVLNMRQTGHYVADYLLSDTIRELMKPGNFEFTIKGEFPKKMAISDSDLCVLIGNALENAKEALMKVEGERYLSFEVRSDCNYIFVDVCNTACEKAGEFTKTDKSDAKNHGYGMGNMRQIIEKYDGELGWEYTNGIFCLAITVTNQEEDC